MTNPRTSISWSNVKSHSHLFVTWMILKRSHVIERKWSLAKKENVLSWKRVHQSTNMIVYFLTDLATRLTDLAKNSAFTRIFTRIVRKPFNTRISIRDTPQKPWGLLDKIPLNQKFEGTSDASNHVYGMVIADCCSGKIPHKNDILRLGTTEKKSLL